MHRNRWFPICNKQACFLLPQQGGRLNMSSSKVKSIWWFIQEVLGRSLSNARDLGNTRKMTCYLLTTPMTTSPYCTLHIEGVKAPLGHPSLRECTGSWAKVPSMKARLNRCLLLWLQAALFPRNTRSCFSRKEEAAGCVLPQWKCGSPFSSWPMLLSSHLTPTPPSHHFPRIRDWGFTFLLLCSYLVSELLRSLVNESISATFLGWSDTPIPSKQLCEDVAPSLPGLRCHNL